MQDSSLTKTILLQTLYVRSVPLSVVFHLLSQLLLIYLLSSFCLIFPPLFFLSSFFFFFFAPCLVCVIIINSTKVQNPRRKIQVALLAEPKTPPGVECVYIALAMKCGGFFVHTMKHC